MKSIYKETREQEDFKEVRETQIRTQIEKLYKSVDFLYESALILEDRLSPILRANLKDSNSGEVYDKDTEESVPLAVELRKINYSVEKTQKLIQSIKDRTEL